MHLTELRTRIDAVRARYGLAPHPYTNSSIAAGVNVVVAVDIVEMRAALRAAYIAAGRTTPSYAINPAVGGLIRAADVADLRAAVIGLE